MVVCYVHYSEQELFYAYIYYYGRLHHSMALDINSNSDTIHVGGIDERVSTILSLCCEREVQVVYAMS